MADLIGVPPAEVIGRTAYEFIGTEGKSETVARISEKTLSATVEEIASGASEVAARADEATGSARDSAEATERILGLF